MVLSLLNQYMPTEVTSFDPELLWYFFQGRIENCPAFCLFYPSGLSGTWNLESWNL